MAAALLTLSLSSASTAVLVHQERLDERSQGAPWSAAVQDPAGEVVRQPVAATLVEYPWAVAGIIAVWIASGLFTAQVMGRRGHEFRPMAALGVVFGPLLVPLAINIARRRERGAAPVMLLSPGEQGEGTLHVLVGFDRVSADPAAFREAVAPYQGRIARLTLARVIDYDSAYEEGWDDAKREAVLELETWARLLPDHAPEMVLLAGDPVHAVKGYALSRNYDLLVVPAPWMGRMSRSAKRSGSQAFPVPTLVVGGSRNL